MTEWCCLLCFGLLLGFAISGTVTLDAHSSLGAQS